MFSPAIVLPRTQSPAPGKTFLDMTFGSGGHTSRLLDACGDCVVVAADADAASHEAALEMAGRYPSRALVPLRSRCPIFGQNASSSEASFDSKMVTPHFFDTQVQQDPA